MSGDGSNISIKDLPIGLTREERGHQFLESQLWANCKFVIGEEKEEISAWKELLAFASSKFAAMFFGEEPEIDPVQLPKMKSNIFKKMLQFIYTHNIEFSSTDEAFEMCLAAHEYDLLDLVEICTVFLKKSLVSSDIKLLCDILNFAVAHDLKKLRIVALKEVQNKIHTLLGSEQLPNLSPEALVAILERGQLNIKSELDLIDAAVRWATVRCEKDGIDLKHTLSEGGMLKHLRFLTLTGKEFREGPVKHGLLSSDEEAALLKHISGDVDEPLPVSLCPNPDRRASSMFNYLVLLGQNRETFTVVSGYIKSERFTNCKVDLLLLGIVISSQVDDSHKNIFCCHYEEEINVKIYKVPKPSTVEGAAAASAQSASVFGAAANSPQRGFKVASSAQGGFPKRPSRSGYPTQIGFGSALNSESGFGSAPNSESQGIFNIPDHPSSGGIFGTTAASSSGGIFGATGASASGGIFGTTGASSSGFSFGTPITPLSAAASQSPESPVLYAVGSFRGRVNYGSDLHVPLVLENGKSDRLKFNEDFKVDVQFHKSGKYPLVVLKKECDIQPHLEKGLIVGIKCML